MEAENKTATWPSDGSRQRPPKMPDLLDATAIVVPDLVDDDGLDDGGSTKIKSKAAMEERMAQRQREAEQRRAAKQNADSSGQLAAFEGRYNTDHTAAISALTALKALSTGPAADTALADLATKVQGLHAVVADAASYLPLAIREASLSKLQELEAAIKEERERLAPRKKFAFKNRKKVAEKGAAAEEKAAAVAVAAAPSAAAAAPSAEANGTTATEAADAAANARSDSFAAPAGCQGFRDASSTTLIRKAGEGMGGDFALENLTGCEVSGFGLAAAAHLR